MNVNGQERYKTLCGSLTTLFIYFWCILFFIDGVKEFLDSEKVPQINSMEKYNAFGPKEELRFEDYDFVFAFGVAGGHNLKTYEPIEKYGEVKLVYRSSLGYNDS